MQKQAAKSKQAEGEQIDESTVSEGSKQRAADLKADLDELLDDIDAVLEENAASFVKAYVQRGGE